MSLLKFWEKVKEEREKQFYQVPRKARRVFKSVPEHYRKHIFYARQWWHLHKQNDNLIAAVLGKTGSGKSWTAIEICDYMDRDEWNDYNFSVERIVFSVEDFLGVIKKVKRYEFILFDEAALEINARTALTNTNIVVSKINQSFRNMNLGVIYTYPGTITFVDKQLRALFKSIIVMAKPGIARYFDISVNPMRERDSIVTRRIHQETDDGDIWVLDPLIVSRPRKELVNAYEEKKSAHLERLYGEYHSSFSSKRSARFLSGSPTKAQVLFEEVEKNPSDFFDSEKGSFTKASLYRGFLKNVGDAGRSFSMSLLSNVALMANTKMEMKELVVGGEKK